jgi:hypothetical protein
MDLRRTECNRENIRQRPTVTYAAVTTIKASSQPTVVSQPHVRVLRRWL